MASSQRKPAAFSVEGRAVLDALADTETLATVAGLWVEDEMRL